MTVKLNREGLRVDDGVVPVTVPAVVNREDIAAITITEVPTSGSAAYVAFPDVPCWQLEVVNNTGTALEYRRGGAGSALTILSGTSKKIKGITNANQIEVKRVDGGAAVTVEAEAYH